MSDNENEPPHPANSVERREPLPDQYPKSPKDDPGSFKAVEKILTSPGYRLAYEDLDFLREPETRGIRLQLEYLKTETLLQENNIAHTIVVFGGSRILERDAAARVVDDLERALAADPKDELVARRLALALRILDKSKYYDMARELGRIVGNAEPLAGGGRLVVMTGGGPGIMEAVNRGACDTGAPSIGLNIALPHEQYPNPYITPELCLRFHYFALRKFHFSLRARALVAFPGGFGTMDELFEILTLSQTRKIPPVPIILVGESYWKQAFNPDFLMAEGVIDPEDRELFWYAESAKDIWQGILDWYRMKGEPLLANQISPP